MIGRLGVDERHDRQRELTREFCESEIEPHVERHESEGTFPADLLARVGKAGFGGVPYPEEYGGAGMDYRAFAVTMEELSRCWKLLGGAVNVACGLVGYPIHEFGAEWQREEWLTPVLSGDWIPALGLTEPGAGTDAASLETTARREGDSYVIDGHKVWTTHGRIADLLVLAVRTGGPDSGHGGISLVGVPEPTDRDGVAVVRDIPCMEGPAAVESELRFDGLTVPVENRIGAEGDGFRYAMEALDVGRIGTAAQGVGVAQAAFEASRAFAGEREQFGRPIGEFQGIGFKLADMATEVEAARLLTLAAAGARDRGERVTSEAAMAKTKATDVAMDAATEAVQIHGSRGYSKDYPVERYMRVAKGMQIYEGTNEVNRIVIANRLYEGDGTDAGE